MSIFLITAPSGAGKTTIAQRLQDEMIWGECISHTTRKPRDKEIDGKTYYFVDKVEFSEMYASGEFAESVEYDGNNYGISKKEIERVLNKYTHVFIIVDHHGYEQVKAIYPDAVGIFIHMEKEICLSNMLRRGDNLVNVVRRIEKFDDELSNRKDYDYVIKNVRGKLEETLGVIKYIVAQYS